jgi:hypothetical protein
MREREAVLTIAEHNLPHAVEANPHGHAQSKKNGALHRVSPDGDSPHQVAYEAGYARGHEAGFQTGYREGFADGLKSATGVPAAATVQEPGNEADNRADNGTGSREKRRLFGLPCVKCGFWFFSDEAQCPRCNTPRPNRKPI